MIGAFSQWLAGQFLMVSGWLVGWLVGGRLLGGFKKPQVLPYLRFQSFLQFFSFGKHINM